MGEAKRKFKTLKKLNATHAYRQFDDWAVGDIVIGTVVDWSEDKYGHKCPVITVEEAMFKGKGETEKFPKGKRLMINSCGKLKKQIEAGRVVEGSMYQIEYLGKNTIEKGKYAGKEAHDVNIDLVEEDDGSDDGQSEDDSDL